MKQMTNLDRVAEVVTESHEEGHLPSQPAVSTLHDIVFFKERIQKIKKARQSNQWPWATGQKTYPEEEREESRVEGHGDNA
jgi:hypothetical protein